MSEAVRLIGLDELDRALETIQHALPDEIRESEKQAAEKVADKARGRAASIGGVAGHVVPAIRVEDSAVQLDRDGEWAMARGAEYGSNTYAQFAAYDTAGYFLTPTVRDFEDREIDDLFGEAADRAIRKAGF